MEALLETPNIGIYSETRVHNITAEEECPLATKTNG